jgi:hypothetical protein
MKAIGNRAVLIGLVSVLFGVSCFATGEAGFELVTADEFQLEKDARSLVTRGPGIQPGEPESLRAADGPLIEVLTPDSAKAVKAPVDISVRFSPGAGATIVLDSLRIRYGLIGLDVTERIRQSAMVTEQGIQARGAALPAGSHSMSIEIADSAKRKTRQAFRFRVQT